MTTESPAPDKDAESAPEPRFADVGVFVEQMIARRLPVNLVDRRDVYWCPRWFEHPEAVLRFTALWMTYEHLRVSEPATGLDTWLRVHADHHLPRLLSERGPFGSCQSGHRRTPPLPCAPFPVPPNDRKDPLS